MDRLDAMRIVDEVTRSGSLSAAARRLRIPLATLSRKVTDLETHLGARIFTRTSRKLALTEAGDAYITACRRILADVAEAERAIAGEYQTPRGELVITAPIVFGRLHVLPLAIAFLKAYPQIDLHTHLSDQSLNMTDIHIDLGVRIGPLADSQVKARLVGTTRRVVCASPDYLQQRGTPATPQDLAGHDAISLDSLVQPRAWPFVAAGRDLTVPIHSRLRVNDTQSAIEAAKAGLGLARVLSYQVADACHRGELQIVLAAFEPEPWPVHLIHLAQGPLTQKVRTCLDFMAPRLKAALAV